MIECFILGDSIAVGVGYKAKECTTIAEVGITSRAFVAKNKGSFESETVIISLGSNDPKDPTDYVEELRENITAKEVIWLIPSRHREKILLVARKYGDKVLYLSDFDMSRDAVHPTSKGYKQIRGKLKGD